MTKSHTLRIKLCPFCNQAFRVDQPVKVVGRGVMCHLACFKKAFQATKKTEGENNQ